MRRPRGRRAGRHTPPRRLHRDGDHRRVTIQDVIDKGNDPQAAQVDVEWPAGQDYPASVSVDQDKMVADEEVTWVISELQTL